MTSPLPDIPPGTLVVHTHNGFHGIGCVYKRVGAGKRLVHINKHETMTCSLNRLQVVNTSLSPTIPYSAYQTRHLTTGSKLEYAIIENVVKRFMCGKWSTVRVVTPEDLTYIPIVQPKPATV